jgi:16S rRNA (guanine966-N2)-methyltransferase
MRVVAGSAKGTRLARVPRGTRPLSDRAREGMFSSLADRVLGARFADLFAGTGAVGIEALSRGAGSCVFVDSAPGAIRAIRENLSLTGLGDRARVVRSDVLTALDREGEPFEVAFLDPPYDHPTEPLRETLRRAATLTSGGTMVLTRPSKDPTDVIPVHWNAVKVLTYGDARVLICREAL